MLNNDAEVDSVAMALKRVLDKLDRNGDGRLSRSEVRYGNILVMATYILVMVTY